MLWAREGPLGSVVAPGQYTIKESYKQLNAFLNLSNKLTNKPTNSRLNRLNTTLLNTNGVDKTLIWS
jgi:hypothetical protein